MQSILPTVTADKQASQCIATYVRVARSWPITRLDCAMSDTVQWCTYSIHMLMIWLTYES
jgi:hypothetical protein